MNPLAVLALVAVGVIEIASMIGAFLWLIFTVGGWFIDRDFDDVGPFPVGRTLLAAAALVVSIALGVMTMTAMVGSDDEASHCGPGTRYVEQDRLVGKTIEHDWMCTA